LWISGKESACNAGDPGLAPGSGRSPRDGNGYPLQYLPGQSHGQRNLEGCNPWGHRNSDTTEHNHRKKTNKLRCKNEKRIRLQTKAAEIGRQPQS